MAERHKGASRVKRCKIQSHGGCLTTRASGTWRKPQKPNRWRCCSASTPSPHPSQGSAPGSSQPCPGPPSLHSPYPGCPPALGLGTHHGGRCWHTQLSGRQADPATLLLPHLAQSAHLVQSAHLCLLTWHSLPTCVCPPGTVCSPGTVCPAGTVRPPVPAHLAQSAHLPTWRSLPTWHSLPTWYCLLPCAPPPAGPPTLGPLCTTTAFLGS